MATEEVKTAETGTKEEAKVEDKTAEVKAEVKTDDKKVEVKADEIKSDSDKKPWYERRVDELTGKWRATEREVTARDQRIALLEATLSEMQQKAGVKVESVKSDGTTGLSEAQLQAKINERATEIASQAEFNKECNRIFNAGTKEFNDFGKSIESFTQLGGLNSPSGMTLVSAAFETDEPHRVLYALSKDLDEAARIMSLPPVRQAAALVKYSTSLKDAKQTSKAPPPISPVNGAARGEFRLDDDTTSMADWVEAREKALAAKRKRA